jgi:hypothetical protein
MVSHTITVVTREAVRVLVEWGLGGLAFMNIL